MLLHRCDGVKILPLFFELVGHYQATVPSDQISPLRSQRGESHQSCSRKDISPLRQLCTPPWSCGILASTRMAKI